MRDYGKARASRLHGRGPAHPGAVRARRGDAEHVDRARRRRRSRAARRAPPPPRSRCAARAASSGSTPSASCAASAEECVQPEPCAAPSGWRGPGISTTRSPSKKRSIASSRCPPVTTTARGPERVDARAPAPRRSSVGRASPASTRASGRLGVTTVARGSSSSTQRVLRRPASSSRAPRLGDHHRVEHDRRAGRQLVERLAPPPRSLGRAAEHPDLDRVDADVLGDGPHLRDDHRRAAPARRPSTATVFCAVIAVIAVMPCTPQRANAFRSAWMPAPPPESEPAIDRTRGTRSARPWRSAGARRAAHRGVRRSRRVAAHVQRPPAPGARARAARARSGPRARRRDLAGVARARPACRARRRPRRAARAAAARALARAAAVVAADAGTEQSVERRRAASRTSAAPSREQRVRARASAAR